jgi:hypothetical protein
MKRIHYLLLLLFILLAVTGCAGAAKEDAVSLPDGPALVMVYTDN